MIAVEVEDHPLDVDPVPWVNFQGDRYMGRDGSMYLLVENPENVDRLGNTILREERLIEENPPVRSTDLDYDQSTRLGYEEFS